MGQQPCLPLQAEREVEALPGSQRPQCSHSERTSTLEEILPKPADAKIFSIVDAKCGYWNVVLDKESSYLTTFNLPFGRYRFKRMHFGLKMSQDVFQTKIDQTFEGCEGVVGIADDIVVFGKTTEKHDRNMHAMLNRCIDTGLKLNPDKCFVKQEKVNVINEMRFESQ